MTKTPKVVKCPHVWINAADPDLTKDHPLVWRWVCVFCGVEHK